MKYTRILIPALALFIAACQPAAQANEAQIRKNLGERLVGSQIDEVRQTPMPGLWEVRIGNEVRYTDANGNYLIEGDLIDVRERRNLTEERLAKLSEIDFSSLPLKDAMVWKQGSGKRRVAVFADPNCRYCRAFEQTLRATKDVTVYTFLIPILGGDSPEKARNIWCAKDAAATYKDWMLGDKLPAKVEAKCDDAAIGRNLALSRRLHVMGTPGVFFEDGSRAPGAVGADELERRLQTAEKGGEKTSPADKPADKG
ncbi:MAG: DsbC family protein [Pelomonas sp.]|nr:DsbC family protein [Roseateles sp.]